MKREVNGIQVNYELSGQEDAPVVVLSHSLGSSLAMWNPQMDALESDFRVLRYDTRGHGGTDAPEGAYTLDELGKDAIGLLDELQMDRVHWVGLSMGGMIGQYMALNHADRLRSLALCDTAAGIPDEAKPMFTERAGIAREQGLGVLVEGTLERWFTVPYLKENSSGVDLIRSEFLATPVAGYIGCTQAILDLDYLDRLSGIDMPTIIVVGEEDPGTPVEASKAMHERIANSKLVVLPSAAHMSNIEQAQRFNSTLLQFLKEH